MMRKSLIFLIRVYRYAISPLMGPHCRFYPSCSCYAQTALERHGVLRGGWLAVRRLARCHPWHPGGVDPVPERTDANTSDGLIKTRHKNYLKSCSKTNG